MSLGQKLALVQAGTILVLGLFLGIRWLFHTTNVTVFHARYRAADSPSCDHPPLAGNNNSNPFASTALVYQLKPGCYDTYMPGQSLAPSDYLPGDYISTQQHQITLRRNAEQSSMALDVKSSGVILIFVFAITGVLQIAFLRGGPVVRSS